MKIMLATLCLNEMEHLPNLVKQHINWPNLAAWVFVESADRVYAEVNPRLVSHNGLSVDGTTDYLTTLTAQNSLVKHVPYGISSHPDPAQGKVASRQAYLAYAEKIRPDFVIVLDADEFYTVADQQAINTIVANLKSGFSAVMLKQRHIWHPFSAAGQDLFSMEAVGGYWGVPHCRIWRWSPGLHYSHNHNTPETIAGYSLSRKMMRLDKANTGPQCVHLGFASHRATRAAKHRYYEARGEGPTDGRQSYVECRAAFETWTTGNKLPNNASVIPYTGPIPEVFC